MKLLKIISVLFIIYFVRRFIQVYKVMKEIQQANARAQAAATPSPTVHAEIVEADFRVID